MFLTLTAATVSVEAMQATLAMMWGRRLVITEAELRTSCPLPSATILALPRRPEHESILASRRQEEVKIMYRIFVYVGQG